MLDKKGFTIAEVIMSFSLVTVILASIVTATVYYRNKVKEEEIITQLMDFKNTVTTAIYDDILTHEDRKIVSASRCVGTANCINLVDKSGNIHILKIEEIEESSSADKRGVYLFYNDTKYMLPDSDLGTGEARICDFVGGFNLDYYKEDDISLYTVKTTFMHKDLDKLYDITLTITHYGEDDE